MNTGCINTLDMHVEVVIYTYGMLQQFIMLQ